MVILKEGSGSCCFGFHIGPCRAIAEVPSWSEMLQILPGFIVMVTHDIFTSTSNSIQRLMRKHQCCEWILMHEVLVTITWVDPHWLATESCAQMIQGLASYQKRQLLHWLKTPSAHVQITSFNCTGCGQSGWFTCPVSGSRMSPSVTILTLPPQNTVVCLRS